MSFKLSPDQIVKTTKTDNGYHSQVFSLDAWMNGGCLATITMLAIGIAIAPISSVLIFFYYSRNLNRNHALRFITPMLFSLYLVIDVYNSWIATELMGIFYDTAKASKLTLVTSIASIMSSLIAMIFFDKFYTASKESSSLFFWLMTIIYFICYVIVAIII